MHRLHVNKLGQEIMCNLFLILIKAIIVYPAIVFSIQPASVRLQEQRKGKQRRWMVQAGKGLICLGSFHDSALGQRGLRSVARWHGRSASSVVSLHPLVAGRLQELSIVHPHENQRSGRKKAAFLLWQGGQTGSWKGKELTSSQCQPVHFLETCPFFTVSAEEILQPVMP